MPFRSKAQRGYMHVHHPEIAARWEREGGTPKNIPQHVHHDGTSKSKTTHHKPAQEAAKKGKQS